MQVKIDQGIGRMSNATHLQYKNTNNTIKIMEIKHEGKHLYECYVTSYRFAADSAVTINTRQYLW